MLPTTFGRYAVFGELARGGMATVHYGRIVGAAGFSRTVAIKRLHTHLAADPEFVAMFVDEARLAARIYHPNVVPTLDVVRSGNELVLVLEYVHGESLSRLLGAAADRNERPPTRVVAAIVSGLLHGLHAAHEAKSERGQPLGIVHRDVSPQNVLVGVDGVARVIDFGIARALGRAQSTHQGQIRGKVAYMAPEQMHGQPLDRRTDVYAAGVVLWEALTGARLFPKDDNILRTLQTRSQPAAPPSMRSPSLGTALDEVVTRALTPNPDHRFATARDMALALEQATRLATLAEVSDWVMDLVPDTLDDRAIAVAAMEEASRGVGLSPSGRNIAIGPSPRVPSVRPPAASVPSAAASIPSAAPSVPPAAMPALEEPTVLERRVPTTDPAQGRRGTRTLWIAAGVGLAITIGSVLATRREPARPVVVVEPSAAAPAPSAAEVPAPVAEAPAESAPTPETLPAAPEPSATSKKKSSRPRAAPNPCAPPYYTDASGQRKYKLECLRQAK